MVDLKRLNLLFKLSVSTGMIIFSLLYQSIYYNLAIILICAGLIWTQRIRIFRFHSLPYSLLIFLVVIFLFRAVSGYGRVVLSLPVGIQFTAEGLQQAFLAVEQIMLIFLLVAVALYSSSRDEVFYYLRKIPGSRKNGIHTGTRWGRVALFVLYLLPAVFLQGKQVSGELSKQREQGLFCRAYFRRLSRTLGDFVVNVLKEAERRYPDFVAETESTNFQPLSLPDFRHLSILSVVLIVHVALIWMR